MKVRVQQSQVCLCRAVYVVKGRKLLSLSDRQSLLEQVRRSAVARPGVANKHSVIVVAAKRLRSTLVLERAAAYSEADQPVS